jgi:hypothetical protein
VVLCLRLPISHKDQNDSYEELEFEVHKTLCQLQGDWQELQSTITQFEVGVSGAFGLNADRGKQIHIIQEVDGKWTIYPKNAVTFFLETTSTAGDGRERRFF